MTANACATCSSNTPQCDTCALETGVCTGCSGEYVLDDSDACICKGTVDSTTEDCTQCASGTFWDSSADPATGVVCPSCDRDTPNCATCDLDTGVCDSCSGNFELTDGACDTTCAGNYHLDSGACICRGTEDANGCTECALGTYYDSTADPVCVVCDSLTPNC